MWRHEVGRIDFDEPLSRLLQLGWGFRESPPIVGARDGGCWAVIGVHAGGRVRADRPGRLEAWAEAVRYALLVATPSGTGAGPSDPPTACDEERARLRDAGWSFSEHLTAQASGGEGWVISGSRGGRRIRVVDGDRSEAWGQALILAAVIRGAAAGVPPEPTPTDHVA